MNHDFAIYIQHIDTDIKYLMRFLKEKRLMNSFLEKIKFHGIPIINFKQYERFIHKKIEFGVKWDINYSNLRHEKLLHYIRRKLENVNNVDAILAASTSLLHSTYLFCNWRAKLINTHNADMEYIFWKDICYQFMIFKLERYITEYKNFHFYKHRELIKL